MCEFNKIKLVRSARKEHTCYLCGEKIEKGQSYREYVGKFWGDFYSTKLHMDCHYMVEAYFAETDYYLNPDEGWDDQIVMDFVNQWLREDGIEPPELKRDAIKLWLELYGNR